jgi:hypothetical protein
MLQIQSALFCALAFILLSDLIPDFGVQTKRLWFLPDYPASQAQPPKSPMMQMPNLSMSETVVGRDEFRDPDGRMSRSRVIVFPDRTHFRSKRRCGVFLHPGYICFIYTHGKFSADGGFCHGRAGGRIAPFVNLAVTVGKTKCG